MQFHGESVTADGRTGTRSLRYNRTATRSCGGVTVAQAVSSTATLNSSVAHFRIVSAGMAPPGHAKDGAERVLVRMSQRPPRLRVGAALRAGRFAAFFPVGRFAVVRVPFLAAVLPGAPFLPS